MCKLLWKVDRTSFESVIGLFEYVQKKRSKKDIFRASYTVDCTRQVLCQKFYLKFNFLYFYIVMIVSLHESQII